MNMQLVGRRVRVALVSAAIACVSLSASSVLAQGGDRGGNPGGGRGGGGPGGGMFGGMFGGQQAFDPSVDSKDIDNLTHLFTLDKAQKEAVKQLFDGYQQQFAAIAKDMRAKFDAAREEARDTGDRSVMGEVMEKMGDFRKQRTQMEQSFFGDVKAVMTEKQLEKWPRFERDRRRTQTIGNGLMSGERVDLVQIVKDLKLSAEVQSSLEPTLDQYTTELDPALTARNKMYEDMQGRIREMFGSGDQNAMEDAIKKAREVSTKVRDVNRKFAGQVETALPEDKRPDFVSAFKRESFPQVYRQTATVRDLDAALKIEDLNEDQKAALGSIKDSYSRDLASLQKDMEGATEEQEANFSPQTMMRGMGGFGNDDSKLGELRRKRRDMDRETGEKVRSLLTEAQREKLPKRDQNEGQDGGRGPRARDNNTDNQGGNGQRRNRQPNRNE